MTPALNFKKGSAALFSLALMAALPALAAGPQALAHVHGLAQLSVAVDGGQVQIQLESPLDSLLGFEHAPRNAQQRETVRAMAKHLRQAGGLFVLTAAAGCQLTGVDLQSAALPAELLQAQTTASPVTPTVSTKTAGAGAHADLQASFSFTCSQPAALHSLQLQLFAAFPGLRQIDAQLATANKQRATRLTAKNPDLTW